jgi:hypothetical protein
VRCVPCSAFFSNAVQSYSIKSSTEARKLAKGDLKF